MKIVIYRRLRLQKPGRRWAGPCGMTAEERLIINRGREASAFFDYIAAVRRGDLGPRPPRAFAFLHGHAAIAWHTSCQAVYTRILNFYMQMVQPKAELEGLERHMLSLTSKATGAPKYIRKLSDHRGLSQGIQGSGEEFLSKTNTSFHREEEQAKERCFEIFRRYGLGLPYGTQATFRSQSASFVTSWERFATPFAGLAEEMLARFTAKNMTDNIFIPELKRNVTREYFWSIHCFEFSVYELFPPRPPHARSLGGRCSSTTRSSSPGTTSRGPCRRASGWLGSRRLSRAASPSASPTGSRSTRSSSGPTSATATRGSPRSPYSPPRPPRDLLPRLRPTS